MNYLDRLSNARRPMGICLLIMIYIFIGYEASSQLKKFSFQQPEMGSLFNIVIYSADSATASAAASHVYRMIDTLNGIYSDYLASSELNHLCAKAGSNEWVHVSPTLYNILQTAYRASEISEGSFDISVGPVIRLWRLARQQKKLPDKDSLRAAKNLVGYRLIEIDTIRKAIRLKKAGMRLDLGGIAKGETAQKAYERLCALGFPFSLLDAGGDIVAGEVPPGVDAWHVAINLPESEELMLHPLMLQKKAVTTSGDLYQYVAANGKRYSHVIDPRSGKALTNSRNVTVIADKGADADWLTKACSVLPVRKSMRLIKKCPYAEVQIAVIKKGKPIFYRSPGFSAYFKAEND